MTKLEKERAKRVLLYSALAVVVAISAVIIVVTAVFLQYIQPNQAVAWVNGHGISRHDRDVMTKYYTYELSSQGSQSTTQDPQALAVTQLQQQLLTADQAKAHFHITATSADISARLSKELTGSGTQANFNSFLSAAGLSTDDYKRLIVAPQVVRTMVGELLDKNKPTVADQWHFARIQAADKKTALSLLAQIAKSNTPQATFTKLAKSKSKDTQTASAGGDLGWERSIDVSSDSLMSPGLITTLQLMAGSHTSYKLYNVGTTWYILSYLGHDPRHKLSSSQIQQDQTTAFNVWYQPIAAKANFNPAVSQGTTSTSQAAATQPAQSQPTVQQPTAVPAKKQATSSGTKK
jgi:hypothetical protein